ncbi:MAG: hypothetical protein ABI583_05860, partial [Betaproteobacteria bacterium]
AIILELLTRSDKPIQQRAVIRYRLSDQPDRWGVAIGPNIEHVMSDLQGRYGGRLLETAVRQ